MTEMKQERRAGCVHRAPPRKGRAVPYVPSKVRFFTVNLRFVYWFMIWFQSSGGVLKKTECGQWVHIVCAESIPELYFLDPDRKERICDLSNIDSRRRSLVCIFCKQVSTKAVPPHYSGLL